MSDLSKLEIDEDGYKALHALGGNFDVIGTMFVTGEGTPEALRMCIAGLREAALLLERICDRWESA